MNEQGKKIDGEKCKENCVHKHPLLPVDDKKKLKLSNGRPLLIPF